MSRSAARQPALAARSATRSPAERMFIRRCALPAAATRLFRLKDTMQGKLPTRKITTGAAAGYSSYGNQIGLATGQVTELYDPGYVAKRMEIGAVIGASPKANVKRDEPKPGDIIVLLGRRNGP